MQTIIKKLDDDLYSGKKYCVKYKSNGFYKIEALQDAFSFRYTAFEEEKEFELSDEILAGWLENPSAYGAFEGDKLIGFVEGYLEKWNNRYRISNIAVFHSEKRKQGIGSLLMAKIIQEAKAAGARMIFLETQTCNENAISFYKKEGFSVIGFDQYAYANEADETHEMLVWMGKKL